MDINTEFTRVARESDLEPGQLFGAEAEVDGQQVAVVLLKRAGGIEAISGTCSHWGGPLAEGSSLLFHGFGSGRVHRLF